MSFLDHSNDKPWLAGLPDTREDLKFDESWAELVNVIAQAEELARSLPPEKTCKGKTWKNLRALELLEELPLMAIFPGKAWAEPDDLNESLDMKPVGATEKDLVWLSPLLVSTFVQWFGSSSGNWLGLTEPRRQILLLVYRLSAPRHFEATLPDKMDEALWVSGICNPSL
ncbi:hypothetical protein M407DRAFT_9018 [Tulasnella calospora MUT 4182]|uniref:Uncharacterized protein n=1 Tax=Tulasnella calospora MUT 4182 TaxID=1051891 RepID=A0A0C3LSA4_9AGAM|nr:hypothetical protein M407DRAFT_9018 [Tulasnella calospora MUT 4182]